MPHNVYGLIDADQPVLCADGDAAAALAGADLVLVGEFSTSWQDHAFLQPGAGVAYIDDAGRVVVETAGQWLHEDRRQIAAILGLPAEQVVVRYAAIGGAFGGREDLSVQHLLALAAWRLRRPVAMVWEREESMVAHHYREGSVEPTQDVQPAGVGVRACLERVAIFFRRCLPLPPRAHPRSHPP